MTVFRLKKYVEEDTIDQFARELQNLVEDDRYDLLFRRCDNGVTMFHSIAFHGRPNFLNFLSSFYPDLFLKTENVFFPSHIYNNSYEYIILKKNKKEVLQINGANKNLMYRSSVMKPEQDGDIKRDVFWHIICQWMQSFGSTADPTFRLLIQSVLRGTDSFSNSILLNLVEFERLSILKFIKTMVKKFDDFLDFTDITQVGEKDERTLFVPFPLPLVSPNSIQRILERFDSQGRVCNMHFSNQRKFTGPAEHSNSCKGREVILTTKEIAIILKERRIRQQEQRLVQIGQALIKQQEEQRTEQLKIQQATQSQLRLENLEKENEILRIQLAEKERELQGKTEASFHSSTITNIFDDGLIEPTKYLKCMICLQVQKNATGVIKKILYEKFRNFFCCVTNLLSYQIFNKKRNKLNKKVAPKNKDKNKKTIFILACEQFYLKVVNKTKLSKFFRVLDTNLIYRNIGVRHNNRNVTTIPVKPRFSLGYWKFRGLGHPARLMLVYGGHDNFEDVTYQRGPPPGYSREEWTSVKHKLNLDFPNLPYLIDNENNLRLTQSHAIYRYLARELEIGSQNSQEKAQEEMMGDLLKDLVGQWTKLCYSADFETTYHHFFQQLSDPFSFFQSWLQGKHTARTWLGGNNLCYADFILFEFIDQTIKLHPQAYERFPELIRFYKGFKALPHLQHYFATGPVYPINGPTAKFK
ncbi:hypothetical protein RFI_02741 [Reticulomyxa filosa]|uniref:glutathione transferase n=1 Tax=Reticulomyxa filosa TaxID=46433 RepID=X6P8G5_RETFI|nr:hypothetical protein RFI_02741 [Reticulomyxa filosa]|eukprot:ETO34354.1 hypothetical protein RFI_02741 [Reticulomyxa filosa]